MTKTNIELEGNTLFITLEESKNKWKNRFLITLNIIAYIGLYYMSTTTSSDQQFALVFIGGGSIVFFSLTWTTIKNTLAKEMVIINEKSFSYKKSYGIVASNLNTIHAPFGISVDFVIKYTEDEIGEILFYKIDKNNYLELIYKADFNISKTTFEEIFKKLEYVYAPIWDEIENVSLN